MNIKGAFALSNMLEVNTTLTGLFIGCKVKQENEMKTSFICAFFSTGDEYRDVHDASGSGFVITHKTIHHGVDKSCADLLTAIWDSRLGNLVV